MKTINIFIVAILVNFGAFAQDQSKKDYSDAERAVVREFQQTVRDTRDRISRLQERAPLYENVYFDDEKVIREAEQMATLIDEGHYVEPSKLEEWISRLKNLANAYKKKGEMSSEDRWNQSIQRSDDTMASGEEVIKKSREKIDKARQELEDQRKAAKINDADYNAKKQKIDKLEERVDRLEKMIAEERQKMDSIKRRKEEIAERNN